MKRAFFLAVLLASGLAHSSAPPPGDVQRRYTRCEVWGKQTQRSYPQCDFCMDYNLRCEKVCHWDYYSCSARGTLDDGDRVQFNGITGRDLGHAQRKALRFCESRAQNCQVGACHHTREEKERNRCPPNYGD